MGFTAGLRFAPSFADLSLRVGPPENFGIVILAFSVIVNLSGPSLLRGLTSSALGVLIALVGLDPQAGVRRFSLGTADCWEASISSP